MQGSGAGGVVSHPKNVRVCVFILITVGFNNI